MNLLKIAGLSFCICAPPTFASHEQQKIEITTDKNQNNFRFHLAGKTLCFKKVIVGQRF
tara:strand:- start:171 stop:347 length:177 start_codon:yes stop_codon:yes gene_type:complete